MATLKEILQYTYQLTFDVESGYDWGAILEVIISSEKFEEVLISQQLVTNTESKKDLMSWKDLFFMEAAEHKLELEKSDNALFEKIKENPLFKENERFLNQLPKVTTELGRELLIDEMIEKIDADKLISDRIIENALKKKSREELRREFDVWNKESKSKTYQIRLYRTLASVAAIIIIGFLIWQPTKLNDDKLFNSYSYNDQVQQNINEVSVLTINNSLATRGNDYAIDGLSPVDYEKAIKAIGLIREGEFYKAKSMLVDLDVESKKINQLLFFQAVAELNTNDEEKALVHFNALREVKDFIFKEDVAFQIAMLELKFGKRKDSKEKLQKIIDEGGKYKESAEEILDKMRW